MLDCDSIIVARCCCWKLVVEKFSESFELRDFGAAHLALAENNRPSRTRLADISRAFGVRRVSSALCPSFTLSDFPMPIQSSNCGRTFLPSDNSPTSPVIGAALLSLPLLQTTVDPQLSPIVAFDCRKIIVLLPFRGCSHSSVTSAGQSRRVERHLMPRRRGAAIAGPALAW